MKDAITFRIAVEEDLVGKRDRRRKREQAVKESGKGPGKESSPLVLEFPSGAPRIRVVIAAGQPPLAQQYAKLYWELAADGTWSRTVASIGDQQDVAAVATGGSHALLLKALCTRCAKPIRVANRSWAVKVAGKFLDRPNTRYLCPECGEVQRQEQQQEKQRRLEAARAERERRRKREEEEGALITEVLALEAAKEPTAGRVPYESPSALALYLAMADRVACRPGESLPGLTDLGAAGWSGNLPLDEAALLDLYDAQLVALAADTPHKAFVRTPEDDDSLSFHPADVRWRLLGDETCRTSTARSIRRYFLTRPGPEAHEARQKLAQSVEAMEIADVIRYLDGLLTNNYRYPEVPEARRQQLADIVAKGFTAGYSAGQMICFAWRAADTAAGWKERKSLGAPEASAATVTILNSKIDQALEAGWVVPEYAPPRWHQQPLALGTFRELAAAVDRVRDRAVIDACEQCDHLGLRDTEAGPLTRCEHPLDIPRQPEAPDTSADHQT
ncbi:hypothetical protein ABT026_00485 [Streptomyces sp. NPDC002734]|uniref:hypothetical protein n=1 Tax=Streptomyces sp. NPDC002734 TaxID=3154426 RepID=UPI00332453F8